MLVCFFILSMQGEGITRPFGSNSLSAPFSCSLLCPFTLRVGFHYYYHKRRKGTLQGEGDFMCFMWAVLCEGEERGRLGHVQGTSKCRERDKNTAV